MPFSSEQFARQLISEALFYDAEQEALGNVSLIDMENLREIFLASFDPERNQFVIEEAVEWENVDADDDGEVDCILAVDGKDFGCFDTPDDAADEIYRLAEERGLKPSFMVLYPED